MLAAILNHLAPPAPFSWTLLGEDGTKHPLPYSRYAYRLVGKMAFSTASSNCLFGGVDF